MGARRSGEEIFSIIFREHCVAFKWRKMFSHGRNRLKLDFEGEDGGPREDNVSGW